MPGGRAAMLMVIFSVLVVVFRRVWPKVLARVMDAILLPVMVTSFWAGFGYME